MRIWFEYELDLMDKKGKGFEGISTEISARCHKFAFLVFKKLEEETSSWLKKNANSQHHADIMHIRDKSCKIKEKIRQKHNLNTKQVDKYEKQVPTICVSVLHNYTRIESDDWFHIFVGNDNYAKTAKDLCEEIKSCFNMFNVMVFCKLEREINSYLLGVEKAFFRDSGLAAIKTDFE